MDRPTRSWKLKEEVENIFMNTERGRLLLSLRQPQRIRAEKGNEEAQRIFFRQHKPKLEGFGIDPFRVPFPSNLQNYLFTYFYFLFYFWQMQAFNMLEGSLQHKLTLCRDTNLQILRLLSTNDKLEELAIEFGTFLSSLFNCIFPYLLFFWVQVRIWNQFKGICARCWVL